MSQDVHIKNKKAGFEYELLDKYTAGIMLTGSEIKSIRAGKASIAEAYCLILKDELWVRNMDVSPYEQASYSNHEPKRDRKLLLQRREIDKISDKLRDVGLTVVVTDLYIAKSGYAKLNIAVGKGKKLYDKRQSIKTKDIKREIDRAQADD